ncbi:nucleoside transporter family [Grosmannia clavigera kw1407]|uniref:Nucleoside transporter family n=1 Tax=Grosmannia clavigera (strain kw1407 / UAMH 11150) TaxID=655863 RepID=F0XV35_GROCL|nr:nucleoside transporter family [Grosmannia clavigera kw1407]EFW98857.1 nucleoside transporter family [Grosmannia clavigera kw1407]
MSSPSIKISSLQEKTVLESHSAESGETEVPEDNRRARKYWKQMAESNWVELRGIQRVTPEEQQLHGRPNYMQMVLLWFSANLTANNIALGFLGPIAYGLSFTDAALCCVFGTMLGCAGTGIMSTWGPTSGLRTMIFARYTMGWWPSRICVLLNIVIMLGYGMIDSVVGGQILSAVADNNLSVVCGIIITAVITWVVTVLGLPIFHIYERYAWAPQLAVVFILVGVAGANFDTSYSSSGNRETINANRLSFLALCMSASVAWSPVGGDYYVYYPAKTSMVLTFLLTWLGETLSTAFVYLVGCGLGSGTYSNPTWAANYDISSGSLLVGAFEPLGRFGKFCGVILALGVIANNVPGTYSAALGFQCLGSWPARVPRFAWNTFGVIIYTICAAVGRNHLYDIFEDFLALMGYWVTIWITLTLEDTLLFRRGWTNFEWDDWNTQSKLPVGLAALASFCIGWVGSVLCMDQVYFIGPLSRKIGDYGADLGIFAGVGFAGIAYPILRVLELRVLKR